MIRCTYIFDWPWFIFYYYCFWHNYFKYLKVHTWYTFPKSTDIQMVATFAAHMIFSANLLFFHAMVELSGWSKRREALEFLRIYWYKKIFVWDAIYIYICSYYVPANGRGRPHYTEKVIQASSASPIWSRRRIINCRFKFVRCSSSSHYRILTSSYVTKVSISLIFPSFVTGQASQIFFI
jgi:hypothetical protein